MNTRFIKAPVSFILIGHRHCQNITCPFSHGHFKVSAARRASEWPHEGAEPSVKGEGLFDGGAEPPVKREEPVNEPESDLTSGITTAFKTFKAQLEQHFTVSTKKLLID